MMLAAWEATIESRRIRRFSGGRPLLPSMRTPITASSATSGTRLMRENDLPSASASGLSDSGHRPPAPATRLRGSLCR